MNTALRPSLILWLFTLITGLLSAAPADPRASLPPHIRQLLWFGERPDWSADGQRFVFLSTVFGDAFEYEVATGRIVPLTLHFRHHGFTRVQYLANGDLLLSGPRAPFDRTDPAARGRARSESYLSVLRPHTETSPTPLDVQCDEGPAVSRRTLMIAWTHGKQDQISIAQLAYDAGVPRLVNRRRVLTAADFPPDARPLKWIETQDFVPPDDRRLTVTAYEIGGTANTDTFLFDLESGTLTNVSRSPESYDEAEGVFPDGSATLVESAPHRGNPWPLIDVYRLELDGSGRKRRLTHFTEFDGWKANQPVVSPDGRRMLFSIGRRGAEAGQGFGIFLYTFNSEN